MTVCSVLPLLVTIVTALSLCLDVRPDFRKRARNGGERWRYYKRYHGKKSVVPNFLKFFPTDLTEFYVMRPARVK